MASATGRFEICPTAEFLDTMGSLDRPILSPECGQSMCLSYWSIRPRGDACAALELLAPEGRPPEMRNRCSVILNTGNTVHSSFVEKKMTAFQEVSRLVVGNVLSRAPFFFLPRGINT